MAISPWLALLARVGSSRCVCTVLSMTEAESAVDAVPGCVLALSAAADSIDELLEQMGAPGAESSGGSMWQVEIDRVVQSAVVALDAAADVSAEDHILMAKNRQDELQVFLEQVSKSGDPRRAAQDYLGRRAEALRDFASDLSGASGRPEPEFVPADFGPLDGKESRRKRGKGKGNPERKPDADESSKTKRGRRGRRKGDDDAMNESVPPEAQPEAAPPTIPPHDEQSAPQPPNDLPVNDETLGLGDDGNDDAAPSDLSGDQHDPTVSTEQAAPPEHPTEMAGELDGSAEVGGEVAPVGGPEPVQELDGGSQDRPVAEPQPVGQADEEPCPPQTDPGVQSPRLRSVCMLSGCRMIGVLDSSEADTDPLMEAWQMIRGLSLGTLEAVERAVAKFDKDLWRPEALGFSDFSRQVYVWGYLAARCAKSEGLEWKLQFPQEKAITSLQQPSRALGDSEDEPADLCVIDFNFSMFDRGGMLTWACPRGSDGDDLVAVSWLPYHCDKPSDDIVRKFEADRIISMCVHDEELTYQVGRQRILAVEAALPDNLRATDEWGEVVTAVTRMTSEATSTRDPAASGGVSRHLKDSLANLQLLLRAPA